MILKRINFIPLYKEIDRLFKDNLSGSQLRKTKEGLNKKVRELAAANFVCYQSNMGIIEARKRGDNNPKTYSNIDWQVRSRGEDRVHAKIAINNLISKAYPVGARKRARHLSDDIVYSVGDMIDRLTIEWIKQADFSARMRTAKGEELKKFEFKIVWAREWSHRVKIYLNKKLNDIDRKGYYESVPETRTYNLSGIGRGNGPSVAR
jgi:hypothetical protein